MVATFPGSDNGGLVGREMDSGFIFSPTTKAGDFNCGRYD
jgi:hypothetical protein